MITIMILLFIAGYTLIALENKTGINKTAIALILCITLWVLYIFAPPAQIIDADKTKFTEYIAENPALKQQNLTEQVQNFIVNEEMIYHLGDVAEILFYLLGAMTIVTLIDLHHGFSGITRFIRTHSKKKAAMAGHPPYLHPIRHLRQHDNSHHHDHPAWQTPGLPKRKMDIRQCHRHRRQCRRSLDSHR